MIVLKQSHTQPFLPRCEVGFKLFGLGKKTEHTQVTPQYHVPHRAKYKCPAIRLHHHLLDHPLLDTQRSTRKDYGTIGSASHKMITLQCQAHLYSLTPKCHRMPHRHQHTLDQVYKGAELPITRNRPRQLRACMFYMQLPDFKIALAERNVASCLLKRKKDTASQTERQSRGGGTTHISANNKGKGN